MLGFILFLAAPNTAYRRVAIPRLKERFPDETPYTYKPLAEQSFEWNDAIRESLRGYNMLDLGI